MPDEIFRNGKKSYSNLSLNFYANTLAKRYFSLNPLSGANPKGNGAYLSLVGICNPQPQSQWICNPQNIAIAFRDYKSGPTGRLLRKWQYLSRSNSFYGFKLLMSLITVAFILSIP